MENFTFNGVHLLICFVTFASGIVSGMLVQAAREADRRSRGNTNN